MNAKLSVSPLPLAIDDSTATGPVSVDLGATGVSATTVIGSPFSDVLTGSATGGDLLVGGGGNDTLVSVGSNDTLSITSGGDVFTFTNPNTTGDVITHFQSSTDSIDIRPLLTAMNYQGADPFADGYITFESVAGGMGILVSPTGKAADAHLLATVEGVAALHGYDFYINPPPPPPPPPPVIDDSAAAGPVNVDLGAAGVTATKVIGSVFSDVLTGSATGGDLLVGGGGNDTLVSVGSNDTLSIVSGGDVFTFTNPNTTGDVITHFQSSTDSIDIRPLLTAMNYQGADPFADGYVSFESVAGGMGILVSPTGKAADAHLLATVEGVAALHPYDFYINPPMTSPPPSASPPPPPSAVIDESGAAGAVQIDLGAAGVTATAVIGSAFSDVLTGSATGGDHLIGGGGNDTLVSVGSNDTLSITSGGDVFTFTNPNTTGDVITHFQSSTDSIDIRPLLTAMNYQGADPFADGHITFESVAGGIGILVSPTGHAADAHLLATVEGVAALHPYDFYINPPPPVPPAPTYDVNDSAATGPVTVDLGQTAQHSVLGSAYDDFLIGNPNGASGLYAGGGHATLVSAGSADTLSAGSGSDLFVFTNGSASGSVISGFQSGHDLIDLSPALGSIHYQGTDPFADGHVSLVSVQGSTEILVSATGQTSDAHVLATVQGVAQLTSADFVSDGPAPVPPPPPPPPTSDLIDDSAAPAAVTVDLGATGQHSVVGSVYSDILIGNPNGDSMLTGGGGNDTLIGVGSNDTMSITSGGDVFTFANTNTTGDVITHFQSSTDVIDVRPLLASINYQGTNPFADGHLTLSSVAGGTEILWSSTGQAADAHVLATAVDAPTLHTYDFLAAGPAPSYVPQPQVAAAGPQTLWVGADQQYHDIASAIAASHAGDTIKIEAGTYENQTATITHALTIEGVGGFAHFDWNNGNIPNGKAIFVVDANVTFQNIELSGAKVDDGNGAGIRDEAGNLTIENSYFHDNQNGILSGVIPTGNVVIDHSSFARNGIGDDATHNVYIGHEASLVATNNYFFDAQGGADIKSRAQFNTIANNSFVDTHEYSTTGYAIDLSDANTAVVTDNYFHRDGRASNSNIIHFGGEVANPHGSLLVEDNYFESSRVLTTAVFNQAHLPSVDITGNVLNDVSSIIDGPGDVYGNVSNSNVPVSITDNPLAPVAGYGGLGYSLPGMAAGAVGVTVPPPPPPPVVDINDAAATGPVTVDLGATNQHSVLGSVFSDTLIGNPSGGNTIYGNDGNDTLISSGPNDTLIGGAGGDMFTFKNPAAIGGVIADFQSSTDGIDLRPLMAAMNYQGPDPFADGHLSFAPVTGGTAIMVSTTGQAADAHSLVTVVGTAVHNYDILWH